MKTLQTLLVIALLTSCTQKIEKDKLVGRYIWSDNRIDTLEIRADGTYEYWTIKPGRKIANSGAWKFNSSMNVIEFAPENFPFLNNHDPEGSWFSRVRSKDDEIHLLYEIDSHLYLRKIKN